MTRAPDLEADIDAWVEREIGGVYARFWNTLDTSARLASWLEVLGWKKEPEPAESGEKE